jgi:hypothetical protein
MIRNIAVIVGLMLGMMATVANPAMGQDSTPASTPMIEQPVVVGETEITWTGEWEYDDASSIEDQATFILIDIERGILQLVSYGAFEDELIEDPDAAIDVFTEAYFESAGAGTVEEYGNGELDDGTIWRLFTFDLQGVQVSLLITAVEGEDDAFVVTTLTANTSAFEDSVTQVQEEFTLNEDGQLFPDLDEEEVTESLPAQATPEASPAA